MRFTKSEKKNLGNPFRFSLPTPRRVPWVRIAFAVAAAVIAGLSYWLLIAPTFAIAKIRVSSDIALPDETIRGLFQAQLSQARWGIAKQHNLFAFRASEFTAAFKKQFAFEQISVRKKSPDTLFLTVKEAPRSAIWISSGRQYALNAEGVIYGPTAGNSGSGTAARLVFYDESAQPAQAGQRVVLPTVLAFGSRLITDDQIKIFEPKFFIVAHPEATRLTLKMGEGWKLYLDAAAPLEDQLANLKLTIAQSIAPDTRGDLEYIDVRFGERIYFKYR